MKEWGGIWTEKKLNAFEKYVKAYLRILNKYNFKTIYFDGFAGSGDRGSTPNPLYLEMGLQDFEEQIYKGAAERISRLEEPHRFDYYYFIEQKTSALKQLREKISPLNFNKRGALEFRDTDCNEELIKLSRAFHQGLYTHASRLKYAALIFLDPFGMQIHWSSIEGLRSTRSDLWLLLPTAIIVNRLLDRKAELKNIGKLCSFFGMTEEEIKNHFYVRTGQGDLFDDNREHQIKISSSIEKIAEIYIVRMKSIWKNVSEKPLVLRNTKGTPLFHFIFASNHPDALKIANSIIKSV